jgi:hypothetical protein
MPSIRLQNMGGIAPRLSARLLPLSAATIAEGTKLWSGEVTPFHEGKALPDEMPSAPVRTIFHIAEAWLAWKTDVDVVIGFTPDAPLGRVYYTGDGVPKVINQVHAKAEAPTLAIVTIPKEIGVGASYGLVVMKGAPSAASALADHIRSARGQAILARHGFGAGD